MSSVITSSASENSDLPGVARKLVYPKSSIQVNLDHHYNSKVYTSSSPVSGNVTIITKRDVRFDSVQILLTGHSRTRVDGVNSPHEVTHTFLKMAMPIPDSTYPVPRVLETGRTYTIPFNFVVPNHLTINACNHHVLAHQLQEQHVRLPPSIGHWEKDDMTPQMAEIEYCVKARVFRQPDLEGRPIKVMEASQRIQVLPVSAEDPPLNITANDKLYKMTKSKTLRKNLLSAKLGRLTADAAQPRAVFLSADGRSASETTAQVELRFDPASADILPPKITSISGKIFAHTYYSSGTIAAFPNLADWNKQMTTDKHGSYGTSASLPSINISHAHWVQHLTQTARRDSGYSSENTGSHSESESEHNPRARVSIDTGNGGKRPKSKACPIFHATTVRFPVSLPVDKKTFIPTFHSCISSRVYVLQLSLALNVGSTTSTVSMALPLQIAVDAGSQATPDPGLPSFETAVEEAEADEYLRPRVLQVPDQQYVGTSMLPGYSDAAWTR